MEVNRGCVRVVIPVSGWVEARLDKMSEEEIARVEERLVLRFPLVVQEISELLENIVTSE